MTPTMTQTDQHMQALERANEVRSRYKALKEDLGAGRITLPEALDDERAAGNLRVCKLLEALPRYGPLKVRSLLARHGIAEGRPVEELTSRQRQLILATVASQRASRERDRQKHGESECGHKTP